MIFYDVLSLGMQCHGTNQIFTSHCKDRPIQIPFHLKIAQVEGDRRVVENRLEANDAMIMRTFEEHKFRYENNERQMTTLVSVLSITFI